MTEVIKTKDHTGARARDITIEHIRSHEGYRIWFGEEFWSTVSTILEVNDEIQGICETFALKVDGCEKLW